MLGLCNFHMISMTIILVATPNVIHTLSKWYLHRDSHWPVDAICILSYVLRHKKQLVNHKIKRNDSRKKIIYFPLIAKFFSCFLTLGGADSSGRSQQWFGSSTLRQYRLACHKFSTFEIGQYRTKHMVFSWCPFRYYLLCVYLFISVIIFVIIGLSLVET